MDVINAYVEVNDDEENELSSRSMDRKTKERKESHKCVILRRKKINMFCHKGTIISESK